MFGLLLTSFWQYLPINKNESLIVCFFLILRRQQHYSFKFYSLIGMYCSRKFEKESIFRQNF